MTNLEPASKTHKVEVKILSWYLTQEEGRQNCSKELEDLINNEGYSVVYSSSTADYTIYTLCRTIARATSSGNLA